MHRLIVLAGVVLVLTACGNEAGSNPPRPVSGAGSPTAPTVGPVSGHVRDPAGKPVAGVLVVPSPKDDKTPAVPEIAITTDAAGRYVWPLPPGSYELVARLGDRVSEAVHLTVLAGKSSPPVDLTLPD